MGKKIWDKSFYLCIIIIQIIFYLFILFLHFPNDLTYIIVYIHIYICVCIYLYLHICKNIYVDRISCSTVSCLQKDYVPSKRSVIRSPEILSDLSRIISTSRKWWRKDQNQDFSSCEFCTFPVKMNMTGWECGTIFSSISVHVYYLLHVKSLAFQNLKQSVRHLVCASTVLSQF